MAGAGPAWEETGVVLRVFIAPVSLAHVPEGASILRYAYPHDDALVQDTHNYLHHLHVHLTEGVARPGRCAHFTRNGSRYLAVFTRVHGTGEDGEHLVTCIWRLGGVTSAIPEEGVGVALHPDHTGGMAFFTNTGRHLTLSCGKWKKSLKPRKLFYTRAAETLVLAEEKVTLVNVDPLKAWQVQRLADAAGVKHNIRARPSILSDDAYVEASNTLLSLVHLLWPTVEDAYTDALAAYLDDVSALVKVEGAGGLTAACPSRPIAGHVMADMCTALTEVAGMEEASRWVPCAEPEDAAPRVPPGGPRYLILGELALHKGALQASTLPPCLTRSVAHYLCTIPFRDAGRLDDGVFVDTIIIDHDVATGGALLDAPSHEADPFTVFKRNRVPVKAVLVAYHCERITLAAVLTSSHNPATGIGHMEVVANLKRVASSLIATADSASPFELPPGVHRCYVTSDNGRVLVDRAASSAYSAPPFTAYLDYAKQQLRSSKQMMLLFASQDPKDATSYAVHGWRPDHSPTGNALIVVCDAAAKPVLESIYCDAVASLP
eukprot:TRINITY_DN17359_c0_g1_i1.p1 TRINITY_DN17359_c0_g1~~TRINITY_DN17359_c0_g1_i1.p1  ORF type:complete len:548 (+),score=112.04 TRINITY_DN17359_c0_g1_i1:79-1722(+)